MVSVTNGDLGGPRGHALSGIRNVAVIGAGISGVSSAAHLLRLGLRVTVFERTRVIGGVWHFDPRPDAEPPFPNERPYQPNWEAIKARGVGIEELELLHAPTSPCYAGLVNNIPTPVMRSSLLRWPEGTEEFVTQDVVRQYIEDIARQNGVLDAIEFDTRVESVTKSGDIQWTVQTRKLHRTESEPGYSFEEKEWKFDAVVVASGHYNIPRVPDIPGLSTWKRRFLGRVRHSKVYRTPDPFEGKTILLIGAGASSMDIAKEVSDLGGKEYQSVRDSNFAISEDRLPETAERVAMVSEFATDGSDTAVSLKDDEPIPGKIILSDGRELEGIDHVVVATGYITSYPFLGDLEQPSVPWEDADEKVVITSDGYITHNLHKDIFYIPDPSLAFIGVSHLVSTFSLFDFQSQVVARVFAGQVQLPAESVMKVEHKKRKAGFQPGDRFHSLFSREDRYMDEVLAWVNNDLAQAGLQEMKGVDDEWVTGYRALKEKLALLRAPAVATKN